MPLQKIALPFIFWALYFSPCSAVGIAPLTPFVGQWRESWELFPNVDTPIPNSSFLSSPLTVFDGNAIVTHPSIGIFESGTAAKVSLGTSGSAQPVDGVKGAGFAGDQVAAIFLFSTPVTSFGGYWGAATEFITDDPATITFDFLSAENNLIGSEMVPFSRSFTIDENQGIFEADGQLMWAGWQFETPVQKVVIEGEFIANDFLQANPVPEPSTLALLLIGTFALDPRRYFR